MLYILPESRRCFGNLLGVEEKIVGKKKAYHKAYVRQIPSTKDGLISQAVNCELSCPSPPAQHISGQLWALKLGISSLTLFSITPLLKPWVQWQGSDLNMFPHESTQTNKYVKICEVQFPYRNGADQCSTICFPGTQRDLIALPWLEPRMETSPNYYRERSGKNYI